MTDHSEFGAGLVIVGRALFSASNVRRSWREDVGQRLMMKFTRFRARGTVRVDSAERTQMGEEGRY